MAATFFGQYLQLKELISPEQIAEALELQTQHNRSLGQLAVSEGLMSEHQSAQLNLRQRETDLLFGELAVSLGWLSVSQLDALLARQQVEHVSLGHALIELGVVSEVRLQGLLSDYHYWNARNLKECTDTLRASDFAAATSEFTRLLSRQLRRVYGLRVKLTYVEQAGPQRPCPRWRLEGPSGSVHVGVDPDDSLSATLRSRHDMVAGLDAVIANGDRVGNMSVTPQTFWQRLMENLCANLSDTRMEPLDDSAGQWERKLCVGYSVQGEPLEVFFGR